MTPRSRSDETTAGRSNDPPILILTSLAAGEKHGYALAQDIEQFAGVRLGPGTLYGAIARLEQRGLIEAVGKSGRRRPYRLSAAGAEVLQAALDDLRAIVDEGSARLARRPAAGAAVIGGLA
jgi:DNA-binding PadR family transcriptional regulator